MIILGGNYALIQTMRWSPGEISDTETTRMFEDKKYQTLRLPNFVTGELSRLWQLDFSISLLLAPPKMKNQFFAPHRQATVTPTDF